MEKSKVKLVNLQHVYHIIYIFSTYIEGMLPDPTATPDHRFLPEAEKRRFKKIS
jgi:hypothetical protein